MRALDGYDGSVTLQLYGTPPSFNAVGFTGNRWKLTKAVKQWKADLHLMMMAERAPKRCRFVHADALLTFPTTRRRDAENYRVILSKALGDALTAYGMLPDDDARYFRIGTVDLRSINGGQPRTDVFLRYRLGGER